MALETAQIFQLTRHNQDASQHLIAQEMTADFEAALKQCKTKLIICADCIMRSGSSLSAKGISLPSIG